jgi:hypothetical protein
VVMCRDRGRQLACWQQQHAALPAACLAPHSSLHHQCCCSAAAGGVAHRKRYKQEQCCRQACMVCTPLLHPEPQVHQGVDCDGAERGHRRGRPQRRAQQARDPDGARIDGRAEHELGGAGGGAADGRREQPVELVGAPLEINTPFLNLRAGGGPQQVNRMLISPRRPALFGINAWWLRRPGSKSVVRREWARNSWRSCETASQPRLRPEAGAAQEGTARR